MSADRAPKEPTNQDPIDWDDAVCLTQDGVQRAIERSHTSHRSEWRYADETGTLDDTVRLTERYARWSAAAEARIPMGVGGVWFGLSILKSPHEESSVVTPRHMTCNS